MRALLLTLTLAVSTYGCFKTVEEVPANSGADDVGADVGDPDVAEPDTGGTRDVGNDDGSRCESDEECAAPAGANASCNDGVCEVSCDESFVDVDGDLAESPDGTGCECERLGQTDETCDGVDDDCDGEFDEDAADQACANQDGVCAGTAVACVDGAYAECDAAWLEANVPDWTADADEAFRCDELDNDCDGSKDEPCCDVGVEPMSTDVGSGIWPVIAPATAGAPQGAVLLVGYLAGGTQDVHLTHVDRTGAPVGTELETTLTGDAVAGLDLAAGDGEYYLAYRSDDFAASTDTVRVGRLDPDLTVVEQWPTAHAPVNFVGNPAVAVGPTHTCVLWTVGRFDDESVWLSCYAHGTAPQMPSPGELVPTAGTGFDIDIASVGDRFALAYASRDRVNTVTVASDGTDSMAGPTVAGTDVDEVVITADGNTAVVAWTAADSLMAADFGADGTAGQAPVTLADGVAEFAVTISGDEVIAAFASDPTSDWTAEVGATPLQALAPITGRHQILSGMALSGFDSLRFAAAPSFLGLLYRSSGIHFVRVSGEGIPICQ